ncbi:MAG: ParB N-terminal domain-containing protein [Spirulina sp.]
MKTELRIVNIANIDFDTLGVPLNSQLLASIKDLNQQGIFAGLLQPLVLIKYEDCEKYKMGAGRRRLRALRELQIEQAPANIILAGAIDEASKDEIEATVTLIENQVRQPNFISDVKAIRKLSLFHLSPEKIREKTGLDKKTFDRLSQLLNLIDDFFKAFCDRNIALGVAERLAKIERFQQRELLRIYREAGDKLTHRRSLNGKLKRSRKALNPSLMTYLEKSPKFPPKSAIMKPLSIS